MVSPEDGLRKKRRKGSLSRILTPTSGPLVVTKSYGYFLTSPAWRFNITRAS